MSRTVVLIFLFFVIGCGLRLEPAGTDVIAPAMRPAAASGFGWWNNGGGEDLRA